MLAKILAEMATLLDMKEVPFKPRAFERAAVSIEALDKDADEIYKQGGLKALEDIDGVGKGIAERIEEYIKTNRIKDYERLKKAFPVDITGLRRVEGIGPQTIKKLYKNFKIKNTSELEKALLGHRLSGKDGFTLKTEERIIKSLNFLKTGHGRYLLDEIFPTAKKIRHQLEKLSTVEAVEYGGSLRRMQETIGDLDFIVFSDKSVEVIKQFLKFPEIESVYSHGDHKALVRLKIGIDGDLIVLPPESMGAALIAWTGSKQHNIAIRKLAEKQGWSLNDYGLWKGKQNLASKTEKEVYAKLGMAWIPPEIRNHSGEIQASLENKLPHLIDYEDIQGDLQVQTNWTDGSHSIKEMAEAAKKQGLKYIAITDHTKSLTIANGNDEKRLQQQMIEIDRVQKELPGIKILKGAEVDIKKDGSLDLEDAILAELDVVGISVHSHTNMTKEDMTARIIRAMENPHADILFHPTGRIVQRREPYKLDINKIIKTAKRTKTILEANASNRSDLKDEHIREAIEHGVKIAIDSDSHDGDQFHWLEYGIAQARRGWAQKKDVINVRPWDQMLKLLK